jgi:carbamate kinase
MAQDGTHEEQAPTLPMQTISLECHGMMGHILEQRRRDHLRSNVAYANLSAPGQC